MADRRPTKMLRLNYWKGNPDFAAHVTVLGNPGEVRIGATKKTFLSVTQNGISFSGGFPSKFNVQGLGSSFTYAGMIQDTPFPLTMIPSTIATPIPRQIIKPPFLEILPAVRQLAVIASTFAGV